MATPAIPSLELAASVCASRRPLMFLDTASILDILRTAFREELQLDVVASAVALAEELVAIPRQIWVVSTANVLREFQANREGVLQELRTHIFNMGRSIKRLSQVSRVLIPERRLAEPAWLDKELEERLLGAMDRLVASMTLFRGSPECVTRARDRLWEGKPPASMSRQEFKDCEIFEEFLELARMLLQGNFDQPIVFVTSNTNDYGTPPSGHAQIASDLTDSRCFFVGNLSLGASSGPQRNSALASRPALTAATVPKRPSSLHDSGDFTQVFDRSATSPCQFPGDPLSLP